MVHLEQARFVKNGTKMQPLKSKTSGCVHASSCLALQEQGKCEAAFLCVIPERPVVSQWPRRGRRPFVPMIDKTVQDYEHCKCKENHLGAFSVSGTDIQPTQPAYQHK